MKQIDRFLLAIIAGVVALVLVALVLAFTRGPQGYLPETTPGAVAHNYLLALKQRDDARAYGYLSPDLDGYPKNVSDFTSDIDRNSWVFSLKGMTFSVSKERITDDKAVVTISETRFYTGGLFSSGQSSNTFLVNLQRQGEVWKIVRADSHWLTCWESTKPCDY